MQTWQMQERTKWHTYATLVLSNTEKISRIPHNIHPKTQKIWRSEKAFGLESPAQRLFLKMSADIEKRRTQACVKVCESKHARKWDTYATFVLSKTVTDGAPERKYQQTNGFSWFLEGVVHNEKKCPGTRRGLTQCWLDVGWMLAGDWRYQFFACFAKKHWKTLGFSMF